DSLSTSLFPYTTLFRSHHLFQLFLHLLSSQSQPSLPLSSHHHLYHLHHLIFIIIFISLSSSFSSSPLSSFHAYILLSSSSSFSISKDLTSALLSRFDLF